jgi:hypothetical protein
MNVFDDHALNFSSRNPSRDKTLAHLVIMIVTLCLDIISFLDYDHQQLFETQMS